MIDWTLSVEFFCLIVILILISNFYGNRWHALLSTRLYQICLWLSLTTISLNILCVFTIDQAARLPLWLNLLLNSCYFLMALGLSTTFGVYFLYLILEHVYDRHALRRSAAVLVILFLVYAAAVVCNLFTRHMFYFDEAHLYQRGPLVNVGFIVLAAQVLVIVICTVYYRRSISPPVRRVLHVLPIAVALLAVYQITCPNVLFNGSIIVTANLLLLLNFQSRRLEVDSLTYINNRSSFYHDLELRLRGHQQFQVITISLRHFTFINQHFGHRQGDALLYEVARYLERVHRSGKAFRAGNVLFALIVPYTGIVAAEQLLQTVHHRLQERWIIEDNQISLDACTAELIHTDQDWSATDILEFLQYSLSQAESLEDSLRPFNRELYLHLEYRRYILQRTRAAIEDGSFQVWFQPLYQCGAHAFTSAEALLRLRDEDGTLLPTGLMIALAEESGMMDQLTWIVLDQVCRLLGSGQVPQLQCISVNLSMPQFLSGELLPRISSCLKRYRVDPSRLKIEITERVFSEDIRRVRSTIEALTQMGIRFYLDDFGTGYSNLSTVLDLPFSCIKLDHSLIQSYPDDQKSAAIVERMLDLFHGIGYKVVAEGVETALQAETLISKGADWLQGYYYAKPMPQDELISFLS